MLIILLLGGSSRFSGENPELFSLKYLSQLYALVSPPLIREIQTFLMRLLIVLQDCNLYNRLSYIIYGRLGGQFLYRVTGI